MLSKEPRKRNELNFSVPNAEEIAIALADTLNNDNQAEYYANSEASGIIVSKVWTKAATSSNVATGFKATGIYHYNPDAIPDIAFAPSDIFERKENIEEPSTSFAVAEPRKRNSTRSISTSDS
ncbi:hypothetical protein FQR65_LT09253 [Abscondita terminalis]|nr:hypothetical protein FQR65_LT09253 [Abscondita terminalis]